MSCVCASELHTYMPDGSQDVQTVYAYIGEVAETEIQGTRVAGAEAQDPGPRFHSPQAAAWVAEAEDARAEVAEAESEVTELASPFSTPRAKPAIAGPQWQAWRPTITRA